MNCKIMQKGIFPINLSCEWFGFVVVIFCLFTKYLHYIILVTHCIKNDVSINANRVIL